MFLPTEDARFPVKLFELTLLAVTAGQIISRLWISLIMVSCSEAYLFTFYLTILPLPNHFTIFHNVAQMRRNWGSRGHFACLSESGGERVAFKENVV